MRIKPSIVLVTPALADANNGNWQTARRWAGFLSAQYDLQLARGWEDGDPSMMIALHARRSAAAVAAWRRRHPSRPLLLVLTGTDLYRDIARDPAAQASLWTADRLVVLNELGGEALPPPLRAKARVCLQSAPAHRPLPRPARHLRAVVVGHLRAEKDPCTVFDAVRRLAGRPDIRIDHVGAALDPALGEQARTLAASHPGYRWLGPLPHGATRRRIAAAHVLVHPSTMEGGAHVVIEALTSGTPVLASRIDGNLGLLGPGYPAVFAPGDGAALAALLARARDDAAMLPALQARCAERAPLFRPAAERERVRALVADLLPPDGDPR